MSIVRRAQPAPRRPRKAADKPPLPASMVASAAKAIKRHDRRLLSPGVAVDVEKVVEFGYRLASPHSDTEAWRALICDALGTRSEATADTFLIHLTELCSQNWHPSDDGGGEWCPDERELNMIFAIVAGIKPRNEMEAALAAQMVAVYLMQMKTAARALEGSGTNHRAAALSAKLARTFTMQWDALMRHRGKRRTTRQTITVSHEKHIHNHHHQHMHIEGGGQENGGQACEPSVSHNRGGNSSGAPRVEHECCPALSRPDSSGVVVPMPRQPGKEPVPQARGRNHRSAQG